MVLLFTILKFILCLRFPKRISFADTTRRRYGEHVLELFRTLEKVTLKLKKATVDLRFLNCCRAADLVPRFLQFKLANRQLRNCSEVARTKRLLLDAEIRNKNKRINKLSNRVSHLSHQFKSEISSIDYFYYLHVISASVEKASADWYQTHQRKFTSLRATARSDANLLDPESVIVNLSDYTLSEVEKIALANGLKFCLPPRKLRTGSYLSNFELLYNDLQKLPFAGTDEDALYFKKTLSEIAFSSMFNYNMNRSKLMNIPREQHLALKNLSQNKEIIITIPDKGSGVIILNRLDYVNKMQDILTDTTKFRKATNQDIYDISRKIETRVRNYLRNHLHKPGLITDDEYKKLYPNGSHIGIMYGLPKVHKSGIPMRPICSAIGTSTYELGKYVANIIKPASTNNLGTDLDNTFKFVEQIKGIDISDLKMASFDVRSLFTNIPLKKAIKVCLDRLYRGKIDIKPHIPEKVLEKLLHLCVCDNTFVFNNTVYQQIDGVAMGSSLGPLLANIYMAHLEEEYILKNVSEFAPVFYRRYVDDTFCLMKENTHISSFLEFVNSIDPNIQFDVETETNNQLPFLDTVVTRSVNNSFPDISNRVKATDRGLLYHFSSFIPKIYKNNLIHCLIYRVYHIASSYHLFHMNLMTLKKKFISNGFPSWQFDNILNNFLTSVYIKKDQYHTVPKRKCVLVLPYLGPLSIYVNRKLKRLINRFYPTVEFRVVYRRGMSIRN